MLLSYFIFFLMIPRPLRSTLFPYTTLFRSLDAVIHLLMEAKHWGLRKSRNATSLNSRFKSLDTLKVKIISVSRLLNLDRKSGSAGMPRPISYAVFCLKKKKKKKQSLEDTSN